MTLGFDFLTLGTTAERRAPSLPLDSPRPIGALIPLAAAVTLLLTAGAFAQQSQQPPPQEPLQQPQLQQEPQQPAQEQPQQDAPVLGNTGSIPEAESAPPATAESAPVPMEGQIVEQEPDTFASSELLGQWINSMDGEALGRVDDLLISADHQVAGVIVDVGGFLGFGAKPVAIQIDRLIMAEGADGERQLILDASRDELEQAPEFVSLEAKREAAELEQARKVQEQASEQMKAAQPAGTGGTVVPTQ